MDGLDVMGTIQQAIMTDYYQDGDTIYVTDKDIRDCMLSILTEHLRDNETIYTDKEVIAEARKIADRYYSGVSFSDSDLTPMLDGMAVPADAHAKRIEVFSASPAFKTALNHWSVREQKKYLGNIYYFIDNMVRSLQTLKQLFGLPYVVYKNILLHVVYITEHERRHLTQSSDKFEMFDHLLTGEAPPDIVNNTEGYLNQQHELDANAAAYMRMKPYL